MITRLVLEEAVCYKCTVHFAMDSNLRNLRLNDGDSFWCPNGHPQHYAESEVSKLKKQNQRLRNELSWAEQEAYNAKCEKKAAKAKLTRTQNRIANGVCPCCNRTFKNVARHMTTKHPDFKKVVT